MKYKVLIGGQIYPVTGFVSFHVSDTPMAQFLDASKMENPDRTMIEIELPDGSVGCIPIPTPIKDVVEYFDMLANESEMFKADMFYILVNAKPKPDVYALTGVSPN